jgi:hypothetical protein
MTEAPAPTLTSVPAAPTVTADPEIEAMTALQASLEPLSPSARARVLGWAAQRYPAANGL